MTLQRRVPRAVILDTNALLMPFQFNVNLDHELRRLFGDIPVLVPSAVLEELSGMDDKTARAALALARKYPVADARGRGDDAVLEAAESMGAAVVTNDRVLISRLKERGIPVVRLRAGSHLVASEY